MIKYTYSRVWISCYFHILWYCCTTKYENNMRNSCFNWYIVGLSVMIRDLDRQNLANLHIQNSVQWLRSKESFILCHRYLRYPYKTNTSVFTTLSYMKWAKFHFSSTNIFGNRLLAMLFILQLRHSARSHTVSLASRRLWVSQVTYVLWWICVNSFPNFYWIGPSLIWNWPQIVKCMWDWLGKHPTLAGCEMRVESEMRNTWYVHYSMRAFGGIDHLKFADVHICKLFSDWVGKEKGRCGHCALIISGYSGFSVSVSPQNVLANLAKARKISLARFWKL